MKQSPPPYIHPTSSPVPNTSVEASPGKLKTQSTMHTEDQKEYRQHYMTFSKFKNQIPRIQLRRYGVMTLLSSKTIMF